MELIQMNASMLKEYREIEAEKMGYVCPICKKKRNPDDFVVDHQHMTKAETLGENGAGLVRGAICFMCNSTEGRMLSKFKMSGLNRDTDFAEFLRSLADYLDKGTTHYIHPNEKPKTPKLGKRVFNKLNKLYIAKYPKRKALEYPKSGKVTKQIQFLLEEFELSES